MSHGDDPMDAHVDWALYAIALGAMMTVSTAEHGMEGHL